jgi:DNA-binding MarR family transcriptional regulator
MPINKCNFKNSRLELLFLIYELGRKIKAISKKGNHDQALQIIILKHLEVSDFDVSKLAEMISVNISSVSESIEKLVNQKLVEKIAGVDKRSVQVRLTELGRRNITQTEKIMESHCLKGFENLSEEEVDNLLNNLNKIVL